MPGIPSAKKEFFAPLQGLRGIAVLYVLLSHLGNAGLFLLPVPHDAIGKVGVWIFFSLSAFLLTTHLVRYLSATSLNTLPVLQYAIHRVFRIYPMYFTVLILHVFINNFSLNEVTDHLLLLEGRRELWAIPVEFQYYFAIPVISILAVRLSRIWVYLLIAALLGASVSYGIYRPETVFSNGLNILPKLCPFLLGSFLALVLHHQTLSRLKASWGASTLILFLSVAGLSVATFFYQCRATSCITVSQLPWLSVLLGLSVAGLIYSVQQPNLISKALSMKPLVYVGEISFSVYLLHLPIIRLVMTYTDFPSFVAAWTALILSIVIASITYRLIERQGMIAGKVISQRIIGQNFIKAA